MTTSSKLSTFVGMAAIMTPMSATAWERTEETKVATNGTPLVQMIAEENDMLGEPWLEYLTTIGYDVSGDWWVATAQSLLNFNPQGSFVQGTSYGIAEGSQWWLPDLEAIQASKASATTPTVSADTNPVIRQSDFIALGEAFADDLTEIKAFQQESETKLAQRLGELEVAQATATTERASLRTDLEGVVATQVNLTETTKEGGAIDKRVDSKLTKVTKNVENLRSGLDSNIVAIEAAADKRQALSAAQDILSDLLVDITKEDGVIDTRIKSGQSSLMITGAIAALVLLLLLGVTARLILRRIRQADAKVRSDFAKTNEELRRDFAEADVKLHDKFRGETKRLKKRLDTNTDEIKLQNERLDTCADAAIPSSFDRAKLDPTKLREMSLNDSFVLIIQAKEGSQQWQPTIERVIFDGGNGPEDRVMIHGLSRRDDRFEQMQPVTLKSAIVKVEEGIVKNRFHNMVLAIAAE